MLSSQLDAFLQLVRDGTMRAAASSLYLSQPAFSARIARLESDLGVQLFERKPGGMSLSAAGQAFLPFAESAELTFLEGIRAAREAADAAGEPGLRIGAGTVVSDYVMPEVIALFRTECPSVRVSVSTMQAADIVRRLHNKELDLGVFHWLDDHLNLKAHALYEFELCPVMAADYDPDDASRAASGAVIQAEWPGRYQLPYEASMRATMKCRQVVRVDSVEVAKRMVLQKIGVAVLPSESVGYELARGTMVRVPVSGHELVRHKRLMAERPGLVESEPTEIFRKLLMRVPSFVPGTSPLRAA